MEIMEIMLTSSLSEHQTQKQSNNVILTHLSVGFFRWEQHAQDVLCLQCACIPLSMLNFIQQLRSANKNAYFSCSILGKHNMVHIF